MNCLLWFYVSHVELPFDSSQHKTQGFPGSTSGKEPICQCRRCKRHGVQSLGQEDTLEKEMATHSSILAWRIPWTEEPGGLQSIGSQNQTQLKRLSTLAHTQHKLQYIFCILALQSQGNIKTQDIVVLAFGF